MGVNKLIFVSLENTKELETENGTNSRFLQTNSLR